MKNYFYLIFLVVFCACNNKEKAAQEELQKAQMMYENQEYFGARQVLDSIKIQYPKEFPVLKQGQLLIKKIEMAEQKRNLIYCDSLLKIRLLEIEDYKKYFIFEKDTEYEDVGTYVYKTHKIEQNLQKNMYVRRLKNPEKCLFRVFIMGHLQ